MEPLLLNLEQAAQLLGLTKRQMYELTRERSRIRQAIPLPYLKIGKRRMFRREGLQEWITKLERSSASYGFARLNKVAHNDE